MKTSVLVSLLSLLAAFAACSSSNASSSGNDSGATSDANAASGEGGGGGAETGPAGGDAAGSFVLTSPAFADGQTIPTENTCAGANVSPELDWSGGPSSAQSYALVVTDTSTLMRQGGPIIHWVVWDMLPSTHQLPASLPGDAVLTSPVSANQVDLRTNPDAGTSPHGFFGPCPNGAIHTYQFEIHAVDVAMLPGVTTSSTSTQAKAAVLAHSVAHADLTGTSDASRLTDAGGQ